MAGLEVTYDHIIPIGLQGAPTTVTVLSGSPLNYSTSASKVVQGTINQGSSYTFSTPAWIWSQSLSEIDVESQYPVGQTVTTSQLPSSVVSAGSTYSGTVTGGTGDNLNYEATTTTAQLLQMLIGTSSSPDATLNPGIKLSRTFALSAASIVGDAADQASGIYSMVKGMDSGQVQAVGVAGIATNRGTSSSGSIRPDTVGVYGVGQVVGSGIGTASGFFATANLNSGNTAGVINGRLAAMQLNGGNNSGVDDTVNATGSFTTTRLLWMTSNGANKVGAGIEFGQTFGTAYIDVGIHFSGAVAGSFTGAISTTDIQSDSHCVTGIRLQGAYSSAAISVKSGAGPVVIGGSAVQNSGAILEAQAPASNGIVAYFGNTGNSNAYRLRVGNSSGSTDWAVCGAAGNFLSNSASGDAAFLATTTGKRLLFGGNSSAVSSVIAVTAAAGLGFFGATEVTRPSAYTLNSGSTSRNLPSGATIAQIEAVLRQIVADMSASNGGNGLVG